MTTPTVDLEAMTAAELTDFIAQVRAMQNALHDVELRAIAVYDRKQHWKPDGATSMRAWLAGMFGMGRDTAHEAVRVAHKLEDLPAVRKKYRTGELSWDQTRAATVFVTPETDAHFAEEAPKFSATHLRRMARRFKPVPNEVAEEAIRDRELDMWWDLRKNRLRFRGSLPAAEGALFEKAIDRLVHKIADHNNAEGPFEYSKARADALCELASTRVGADPDPDRATIGVHVDAKVLAGREGMAELDGGNAIAMETARRLACDSRWYIVIDGPEGLPIGIGRTSRQIPAWLASQVRHRDGGCRFPGCERRGWVQIHHLVHWGEGGPSDLDNLLMLCGTHHRLVHEGGWKIVGDPNGTLTFIGPGGRWFEQGPPALRETFRERVAAMAGVAEDGGGPSP